MIKEIVAQIKDEGLETTFRIDNGYFDNAILETIESLGGKYVIKAKGYPTLVAQVTDPSITFGISESGRKTTEFVTTLNTWEKDRRFVVSRVLRDEKIERNCLSLKAKNTIISFLSPTRNNRQKKWFISMKNTGTVRITPRKPSMSWRLETC